MYEIWQKSNGIQWRVILKRAFMREAFLLIYDNTIDELINPAFDLINGFALAREYEQISYNLVAPDISYLNSFKDTKRSPNVKTKINWFKFPPNFDINNDITILYFHGGGFAIKQVPVSLIFLNNLSKCFPNVGIMLNDYTTTASNQESCGYPRQLFEALACYEYIVNTLQHKKVWLVGESAGGNIVLSLLQYLEQTKRKLPLKAVVISPWCNPTIVNRTERAKMENLQIYDGLSFESLDIFSKLFVNELSNLSEDYFANIEYNFKEESWLTILNYTDILVSYGTNEILSYQISNFIKKLLNLKHSNFNESNILIDKDGGHIEPLMLFDTNIELWRNNVSIETILNFLEK